MFKTECKRFLSLIERNTKCYFKNPFTFFMSLITPLILLALFITFLKNIYSDSFRQLFEAANLEVDDRIINGATGAWLLSSVTNVSSVTVAFCSNVIMVEDRMNGNYNDFAVSPVKGTTLSVSYFISNFLVTFIVVISVMLIGHIYLAAVGWYIPASDALMIVVDIIIAILFGTLLAAVFECFINSQGGLSAVSTLVSSMYGFISGAYMPLFQFSEGLRNALCLLPGTYGVGIIRNHYLNGYLAATNAPEEVVEKARDMFDANLYVFGNKVPLGVMYAIILSACAVLLAAYVAIVVVKNRKKR